MGEPFSSEVPPRGRRFRWSAAETKLQAAKECLLGEVERLPGMRVAVLGFTSQVSVIYEGDGGLSAPFTSAIAEVEAADGTDIAVALDAAIALAGPLEDRPTITRVLLITDGLSDPLAAKAAALRCQEASIAVDVILIDPTDEAVELATDIARLTSGRWDPVHGGEGLGAAMGGRTAEAAQLAARADQALERIAGDTAAVEAEVGARERLVFTASHPGLITPRGVHPLTVFVGLPSMRQEIERRIGALDLGPYPAQAVGVASSLVDPGRVITLQPVIPEVRCLPMRADVLWEERLEEVRFELEYVGRGAEASCSGHVEAFVDGLIVARIPVLLTVATEGSARTVPEGLSVARMVTGIFASYAHEDDAVVRLCKGAYRPLGINLIVDRDDLEAGVLWRPVIRHLIASQDLFQLYWSDASAQSAAVEEEWRLALQVAATKPSAGFIRPLFWKLPMPAPPADLEPLHFRYLDLQPLAAIARSGITPRSLDVPGVREVEVTFPVLAYTMDPTGETTGEIQRALRFVVPLVERLAGLRYHPVTTLLVDEHVVAGLRRRSEVDWTQADHQDDPEKQIVLELLRRLALLFHVRDLFGEHSYDRSQQFEAALDPTEKEIYSHIRRQAEGPFYGLTEAFLDGYDPSHTRTGGYEKAFSEAQAELQAPGYVSTWKVVDEIEWLLAAAGPDELRLLRDRLGDLRPDLVDDWHADRDKFQRLVEIASSDDFISIARRHDYVLLRDLTGLPSVIPRDTFPAYAEWFCETMLGFVTRINRERPDRATLAIYVSDPTLTWLNRNHSDTGTPSREPDPGFRDPEHQWSMDTEGYERLLRAVCERALRLVRTVASRPVVPDFVRVNAPTYGVFTQDVSDAIQASRPSLAEGTPAVLVCADAFQRLRTSLGACGHDDLAARRNAARFLFATLVHEHFHAVVATGVDRDGHAPSMARDHHRWSAGRALNESLAAWAQLHAARDEPDLFRECTEYIEGGAYPEWPYRGAQTIERQFQDHGLGAVKSLVSLLRTDPEIAQRHFDEIVQSNGNP